VQRRTALDVLSFQVQKDGSSPQECEDAFFISTDGETEGGTAEFRVGLADGATESAFSKQWAELLVAEVVDGALFSALFHPSSEWSAGFSRIRRAWRDQVMGHDLPWYLEQKVDEGAFAAVLGVQFTDRTSRNRRRRAMHVRAVAIGDTCMFHVRDGLMLSGFPLDSAQDFSNRPFLVGTRSATDHIMGDHMRRYRAVYLDGDHFYLATDALAHFILRQIEEGVPIWDQIDELANEPGQDAFDDWIYRARRWGHMRNDDVTLVKIVARTSPWVGVDDCTPG
jgi:hypothetical protein